MKNFEKWEKEILDIVKDGEEFAVVHGKPVCCCKTPCRKCDFWFEIPICIDETNTIADRIKICHISAMEWLYAEYVEKFKLTKQERKFCELFEGKGYYIARDENGGCFGYTAKPDKNKERIWHGDWFSINGVLEYADIKFDFIKWEDEEPWAIDDLLKLEVVDD